MIPFLSISTHSLKDIAILISVCHLELQQNLYIYRYTPVEIDLDLSFTELLDDYI